jgi:steroid 5-alpha reductase family enzyme
VRCPNYFGEITFWTGVFIGGLTTYRGIGQWLFAIIGYIAIVYIMINGAQRLDRRQEKANGHKPEYRAYADSTPLIVPFIPVSHIGSYKD